MYIQILLTETSRVSLLYVQGNGISETVRDTNLVKLGQSFGF